MQNNNRNKISRFVIIAIVTIILGLGICFAIVFLVGHITSKNLQPDDVILVTNNQYEGLDENTKKDTNNEDIENEEDNNEEIKEESDDSDSEDNAANNINNKHYDSYEEAYKDYLSSKENFADILSRNHSFNGMAYEPLFIGGFTLFDIDQDKIPELLILGQRVSENDLDYCLEEKIFIYTYNEDKKTLDYVNEFVSSGTSMDSFEYYADKIEGNFLSDVAGKYDLPAGIDKDGNLIIFVSSFDVYTSLRIDKVVNYKAEDYMDCVDIIFTADVCESYENENEYDYSEEGDRTEAEEVLKSMTPLVFFDINEENINLYIKGSYSNIMDGYTVGDVKKTLLNNIKKCRYILENDLDIDGYISKNNYVAYNIENLVQFDTYKSKYFFYTSFWSSKENDYTKMISSESNKISKVLDLDYDGNTEAIVCEILDEGNTETLNVDIIDDYYLVSKAFFIDEDKNVTEIEELKNIYILNKQCYSFKDKNGYITLNGYEGVTPKGYIFTAKDNALFCVTNRLPSVGHKFFISENEIEWIDKLYAQGIELDKNTPIIESIKNGAGIACYSKYHFNFNSNGLEINIIDCGSDAAQINNIAPFDESKYLSFDATEYILSENELFVTYARIDDNMVWFKTDIYYLCNGKWYFIRTDNSIYLDDPINIQSNMKLLN